MVDLHYGAVCCCDHPDTTEVVGQVESVGGSAAGHVHIAAVKQDLLQRAILVYQVADLITRENGIAVRRYFFLKFRPVCAVFAVNHDSASDGFLLREVKMVVCRCVCHDCTRHSSIQTKGTDYQRYYQMPECRLHLEVCLLRFRSSALSAFHGRFCGRCDITIPHLPRFRV